MKSLAGSASNEMLLQYDIMRYDMYVQKYLVVGIVLVFSSVPLYRQTNATHHGAV